jgi:Rrf2 family protein
MKFSAQEEYGLRCLARLALAENKRGLTIQEIGRAEGISSANAAKLLRLLRIGGVINSARGQTGGYRLARKPEEIKLTEALGALGDPLYDDSFCEGHKGVADVCANDAECSIRAVWGALQGLVDSMLERITLADIVAPEHDTRERAGAVARETHQKMIERLEDEPFPAPARCRRRASG